MITNKTPLRVKEYIYLSVMWLLRQIFDSNYGKKKTKYDINSYEEYELALKVSHMAAACNPNYPKVNKFILKSFKDVADLSEEVSRYEKLSGIKWNTSEDKAFLDRWRRFERHGIKVDLLSELKLHIMFEFLD